MRLAWVTPFSIARRVFPSSWITSISTGFPRRRCLPRVPGPEAFASQTHHHGPVEVGVRPETLQPAGGKFQVEADLAAADGMAEGDRAGDVLGDPSGNGIGAKNRGDDGNRIPDARQSRALRYPWKVFIDSLGYS